LEKKVSMSVEERWILACGIVGQRGAGYALDFGLCFPGLWRGKSNFSPIRGALLKNLLGESWYERIYSDPKSIWLTPDRFGRWKRSTEIIATIRQNILRWLHSEHLLAKLSAVGWAKLLQAAYDFEIMDLFEQLWDKCNSTLHSFSPDQQALLFQIY